MTQFLFADDTVQVPDSKRRLKRMVGRDCRRSKFKAYLSKKKVRQSVREDKIPLR